MHDLHEDARGAFRRASAPGAGALHVWKVRGRALRDLLNTALGAEHATVRTLSFTRVMDGDEVVDEVLWHLEEDDGVETLVLTSHGGAAIEARMRAWFGARGFVEESEAHSRRLDPIRAAAERGLRSAWTFRSAAFFLNVSDGALERRYRSIDRLIAGGERAAIATAIEDLSSLESRAPAGIAWTEPPIVVIAGPVNAGKSTLFNALLDHDRALTSDIPGTTRDVIEAAWSIDGLPFRLLDTAGLRETADPVESEGLRRAGEALERAQIRLSLRTADAPERRPATDPRVIDVLTMIDRDTSATPGMRDARTVFISARTGAGLPDLRRTIAARAPFAAPVTSAFPCPFTREQLNLTTEARQALAGGRSEAARRAIARLLGD